MRTELRPRQGRGRLPGVRLSDATALSTAERHHPGRQENLPRGQVRPSLRARHGRERLHLLRVQATHCRLPAAPRMQEEVQLRLQDEQARLPRKCNAPIPSPLREDSEMKMER